MAKPKINYDWINTPPTEEDVKDDDGIKYIPYEIIKGKLDFLCPDTWGTQNFNHFIFYMPDKRIRVSGSVEVLVRYYYTKEGETAITEVNRTLSGAATFYADEYWPNEHWAATVKSLAVVNAVQVLGPQFGWGLNPVVEKSNEEQPKKKQPIDVVIKKKLDLAIMKGDEKTVNEIKENYVI